MQIKDNPAGIGIDKIGIENYEEYSCSKTDEIDKECVVRLIQKYSNQYEVSQKLALDIAACESSLKPTALGDGGKAYGIYQFHKPTFELFSKKLGEKLNYYNTEDNIKLAIWALANDKGHHWSCYKKLKR